MGAGRPWAATGLLIGLLAAAAPAGIELVVLPGRDRVEPTIYREVDLTLVREHRTLTLARGANQLEFSWAGTTIDPTSLELAAASGEGLRVLDRSYPPRVARTLRWAVEADQPGPREVEISYFVSGVGWSATWQAVASEDGARMDLDGDVRISNRSGEDFEDATVRLVVGKPGLVETVAELARRREGEPAGRHSRLERADHSNAFDFQDEGQVRTSTAYHAGRKLAMAKVLLKESLADQYLFSIPGTETIRNGWDLRLPSLRAREVPFTMLYRFDEARYGRDVHGVFQLANTVEGKLGHEPLPDGRVQVFRRVPGDRLAYLGACQTKYVPVGEKAELDLGVDPELGLAVTPMAEETSGFAFDPAGDVEAYDSTRRERIEIRSAKAFPLAVEVFRHFPASPWTLATDRTFETVDLRTAKLTFRLPPGGRDQVDLAARWREGR